MSARTAFLTLAVAASCALAACGGGSSSSSKGSGGGSSSTASSGGGEAAKPASQILDDVASAMSGVKSYHVDGTQTDKDGHTRVSGDVATSGDVQLHLAIGARTADILVVGGKTTYLRANDAYWTAEGGSQGPQLAKMLSGRWVKVPPSAVGGLASLLDPLKPTTIGYCAKKHVGTLTKAGSANVGGQPAVIIASKGDVPGGSPGQMYVAATGRPLPLRLVQTGPKRPGGTKDPRCDDAHDTTTASDVHLSNFDQPVHLTVPKNALDLGKLAAGGSQSS